MRGVARAVGVSLGAVQHHFATKELLWRAAMDAFLSEVRIDVGDENDPDFIAVIEKLLAQGSARPGLLAAILSDRAAGSSDRLAYVAERFAAQTNASQVLVERYSVAGDIRPIDARVLLMLLGIGISSIAGASESMQLVYGYDLDDPDDRATVANAIADIIGLGLLPR